MYSFVKKINASTAKDMLTFEILLGDLPCIVRVQVATLFPYVFPVVPDFILDFLLNIFCINEGCEWPSRSAKSPQVLNQTDESELILTALFII